MKSHKILSACLLLMQFAYAAHAQTASQSVSVDQLPLRSLSNVLGHDSGGRAGREPVTDFLKPGSTSPAAGNIATWGASGNLITDGGKSLPSGSIVGTTDAQTLPNKTLPAPVIANGASFNGATSGTTVLQSSPVASGTLTLPASTDTLLGASTPATVTNKSISSDQLKFIQSGTGAVQRTQQSKNGDQLSVLDFNVDPTGVNDSTAGWQAAINQAASSGRELYCPYGTYKTTTSLVGPTSNTVTLNIRGPKGNGCSIQPVFATGQPVFKLDLSGLCWNTQTPCFRMEDMNFLPPQGAGAATTDFLEATNQQYITLRYNIAAGYRRGVVLTTSYSPILENNFGYNLLGSWLKATLDPTMNNARIVGNTITGSGLSLSEPVMNLGSQAGQTVGALIMANNLNGNYGCFLLHGLVATNFIANYCEQSTAFSLVSDPSSVPSTGLSFTGNVWSQNATTNISAITKSKFDGENLYNNAFVYDSHTASIEVTGRNNYAGVASFPVVSLSGGGTGAAFAAEPTNRYGTLYTGTGSFSSIVVTFAPPWSQAPSCIVQSNDGASITGWTVTATSLTIATTSASKHITWSCGGD